MGGVNFKPVGDMILIEEFGADTTSKGGIIIPDVAQENQASIDGIVAAVSAEVEIVEEGDHVVFKKYSGTHIALGEEAYLCIKEEDVLGIIP